MKKIPVLILALASLQPLAACSSTLTEDTNDPLNGDGDNGDGDGDGDNGDGDGDGDNGDGDGDNAGDGDNTGDGDGDNGDGDTGGDGDPGGDGDTGGDGDVVVGDGDGDGPITGSPYDCDFGEPVFDSLAPSTNPPGGLAVENVPQFIAIGWDDNRFESGIEWSLDLIKNKKNPAGKGNKCTFDGSPARFSYYVISSVDDTTDGIKKLHKRMYTDGNEVGNHTNTHGEYLMQNADVNVWKNEIGICNDYITGELGIPASAVHGFRTPFLQWSDATFDVIASSGFAYDCSVEHYFGQNGFQWPFSLDHAPTQAYRSPAKKYAGLWEAPVAELLLSTNANDWQAVTGLDYNMWDVKHMSKSEFVNTLKVNLEVRMKGRGDAKANRAPLFIGAHTDMYSPENELVGDKAGDRREAIEEFVEYALAYHPDVRIVPYAEIMRWMRSPVGLDGTKGK